MRQIFLAASCDTFPGLPFRSHARLQFERFIHTFHYPLTVHPHSLFKFYWEMFVCVCIVLHSVTSSLIRVMLSHSDIQRHVFVFCFQLVGLIDIFVNFLTGFVSTKNEGAVLRPRMIFSNYLRTWFLSDFLSSVPIEGITFAIYPECYARISSVEYYECHVYIDALSFLSVLRLCTFCRYTRNIVSLKLIDNLLVRMLFIFYMSFNFMAFILDVNTQILYVAEGTEAEDYDVAGTALARLLKYLGTLTTVLLDSVYYESIEGLEMYLKMLFMILAFFGSIIFIGFCTQVLMSSRKATDKYHEMEDSLRRFLAQKQIPKPLVSKSLTYLEVLLGRKYYREEEILKFVPESFKLGIILHLCLPHLKRLSLVSRAPTRVLEQLSFCMRRELYLPNDALVRAGQICTSVFFVHSGTVALYSRKKLELRHCGDGSHFGEENLFRLDDGLNMSLLSTVSAVAIEVTDLFRLDQEDFLQVLARYPEVLQEMRIHFISAAGK